MTASSGTLADAGVDAADRPLRKDAERNRRLILQVAAEVFAERGLDAGFDEIARRAGVGVGTVYRRFPDRADLVAALFEQILLDIATLAEAAIAMPDAWDGLVHFLERTTEKQAHDRGLKEVMATIDRPSGQLTRIHERLVPAVAALLDRAKQQGTLRPDVEVADLAVISTLISSAVTAGQPELWRRYLTLFLDALREHRTHSTPLPLSAPPDDDIAEVVGKRPGRRSARR